MDAELLPVSTPDDAELLANSLQRRESNKSTTNAPWAHRGKLKLVTKEALDQRTLAARQFNQIVTEIGTDLGGTANLTQIERSLIDAYAGASLLVNHLTAKMLEGEQISLVRHASACGALVRIATRLGIKKRTQANPTPDLGSYLSGRIEGDAP